jgi:predicted nucleic-acid-binding Zn-ribbon protein
MGKEMCAKCGSGELVSDVRLLDHGHLNERHDLELVYYVEPTAILFKEPVKSPLRAMVCGACGFVELYATAPQQLLAASKRRQARETRGC